jgi:hypothetical protein
VWLALSPGRRRLRFSFQFNDVKDPTGLRLPHCLAPVVGGGGYLLTGLDGVNRPFLAFATFPRTPDLTAKITSGRPGGFPRKSGSDSIEARENTHFEPNFKRFLAPAAVSI